MFDCDDDVVVIALWIIAIGFIILAIDKTTKLNDSTCQLSDIQQLLQNQQHSQQQTQQQGIQNHSAEDMQFYQIQQQLKQMGNRLNDLKRNFT